jgi:hypothetical protein
VFNPEQRKGAGWRNWARKVRASEGRLGSHRFPSFFIIGPPRTGTTWLYEVLRQRTLLPGDTKETRFFDLHFHCGLDWYLAHYPRVDGNRLMGEVAPTYFASRDARSRMKMIVPQAKVVCIFRDPLERLFSLYRVKRAYGMIPWNFEEALQHDPELMETSRYATHLKAWQQDFGPHRVLPTLYDDLRDSPQQYVDRLADFIGIPRFALTEQEVHTVYTSENMTQPRCYLPTRGASIIAEWLKARHFGYFVGAVKRSPVSKLFLGGGLAFSGISGDVAEKVQRLFSGEIEDLERILHRDLSAWKALGALPHAA